MTHWTQDQYEAYIASNRAIVKEIVDPGPETPDEGPESRLQAKCIAYCKGKGWLVWHDYSRGKNEAGWPDLSIYLPGGRHILIELKAGEKGLRKEQQDLKKHLGYHGHKVHEVRSYVKFLEVVRGEGIWP